MFMFLDSRRDDSALWSLSFHLLATDESGCEQSAVHKHCISKLRTWWQDKTLTLCLATTTKRVQACELQLWTEISHTCTVYTCCEQSFPLNISCTRFNRRVSNILYAFRRKQRSVSYRGDVTANQNIHNMPYSFHASISSLNSFASVSSERFAGTLVLHACPLPAVITNDKQNGPFQTTACLKICYWEPSTLRSVCSFTFRLTERAVGAKFWREAATLLRDYTRTYQSKARIWDWSARISGSL
jgi:hypothetical protein